MAETVRLSYHRPPDRTTVFEQQLIHADEAVCVTFHASTPIERPLVLNESVALEPGSPAVWFTFPGRMHDIGRFHARDGTFTGLYANILTPVEFHSALEWSTTDLFVDVWLAPGAAPQLLDLDELDSAVRHGWIEPATGRAALAEAALLVEMHGRGEWPPAVVNEWPLTRVRSAL